MPRDGSGVYSKPSGTTAVTSTTIESAKYNSTIDDLVADANTARPVLAGGTGATSANAARANLGVAIGTNVQAFDATLTSIAALGTAANKGLYATGVNVWAEFTLTAAGRALLDDANAAAQRTTLGLGTAATRAAEDTLTDGANLPDGAAVKAYVDGFTSSAQTITSAGQLTLAHGMARAPRIIGYRLVCSDAGGEAGYSQNDEVIVGANNSGATTGKITTAKVDATNIVIRFANAAAVFSIAHATTGVPAALTNSKWDFYVEGRY